MADDTVIERDDRFIRAGEYALGVLEGDELAQARRLLLSDQGFADAVDWWNASLGVMAEAVPKHEPSLATWQAINTRIEALGGDIAFNSDNAPTRFDIRRGPSGWSIATALAGVAAAVAALILFVSTPETIRQPAPVPSERVGERLIAQIEDANAGRKLAGLIDLGRGNLSLNIVGLEAEEGYAPELWVIPADGTPVSLGTIPDSGTFNRKLTERERTLLADSASIAVTFEAATDLPHDAPTPPILLVGALDQI